MIEWLAMDGHGVYVWSAYAASAAALVGMGVWPWLALRRARRRIVAQLDANVPSAAAANNMEQPEPDQGGAA